MSLIKIPTQEARQIVEPIDLVDVLEALKGMGFIRAYEVTENNVRILESESRRVDLHYLTENLSMGAHDPKLTTAQRRPSRLKKGVLKNEKKK